MADNIILSSAYLAPVSYYRALAGSGNALIEQCDHYHKQTYRNRCRIMTGNGVMELSVPVLKSGNKVAVRDLKIAYVESWQQVHWRAIASAYNSSPFFEYYRDDFEPFYTKKTEYLIDFNMGLMEVVNGLVGIKTPISLSEEYVPTPSACIDLRDSFSPKNPNLEEKTYYQVFDQKYGFKPDLSILDLLFNMGPESLLVLKK
ncbi:MAG: WbqC family protein [Paludibacteraceae bacterium]|nr:WbqC family protein [Paludibacteraceae bacterium]